MRTIVVPVKSLEDAKSRLRAGFSAREVRGLVLAMASDVMAAAAGWDMKLVIASDPEVAELGARFGFRYLDDPGEGLNAAVELSARVAAEGGASSLTVLPSDVPLVTPADLWVLEETEADVALVVSPDGGTNSLRLRPPSTMRPLFGPQSAEAHRRAAAAFGLSCKDLLLSSLILDVDEPAHVRELALTEMERRSVGVARALVTELGLSRGSADAVP